MSTGPVNNLTSSYLQSILGSALQDAGVSANQNSSSLSSIDLSMFAPQSDSTQVSPFAQLMGTLQQLQQSDPTKYQQVTSQIATNLQKAAQTAQSDGNTTAAAQLNQLSSDFTQTGQLPNISGMSQAVGGHHHHHHAHAASADSSSSSSSSTTSDSANQTLSQLLAAFQTSETQNDALDPMSIITNTLASAGITSSDSNAGFAG